MGLYGIWLLPAWFNGAFSCQAQYICIWCGKMVLKNSRLEPSPSSHVPGHNHYRKRSIPAAVLRQELCFGHCKWTSVRLVLRLSLAAMARHSRMSKGIWLLFLRLSGRTCARCSMSLCLFIVRMMSSIRLQQFVCVKFPDGSKKAQVKFEIGFFFCFIMLYYKYKR